MRLPSLSASAALAVLLGATLAHPLAAQQPARPTPIDTVAGVPVQGLAAILLAETLLESERSGDAAAAARVTRAAAIGARGYQAAAGNPGLSQELLARVLVSHYARRSASVATADQASNASEQLVRLALLQAAQNARMVEQNDRMIALLETIAAKGR